MISSILQTLKVRNGTLLHLHLNDNIKNQNYINQNIIGGENLIRGYKNALNINIRCLTGPNGELWITEGNLSTLTPVPDQYKHLHEYRGHALLKGVPFHFRTVCKKDRKTGEYKRIPPKWYLLPGWTYNYIFVIESSKNPNQRPIIPGMGLASQCMFWRDNEERKGSSRQERLYPNERFIPLDRDGRVAVDKFR